MPPTVKSLEERIDDLAEDVVALKVQTGAIGAGLNTLQAQLASVVNGLSVLQAQLAAQSARLDAAIGELSRTNDRLDAAITKVDAHATEFSAFRGRTEHSFGVAKWAVTFAAGVFITVLGSALWVVRETDRLSGRVEQQQKVLDEIRRDVADVKAKAK
jgi:methyl-accepting chemotaxis protein